MGGRAAVWLVLLEEDCCYSLQVAVLPPSLPLQPMRGPWWRVVPSVLHICYPSPPILHPMMGLKNSEEVGEVLAGWLAISGGQVTTTCSEESKLPTQFYPPKYHLTIRTVN